MTTERDLRTQDGRRSFEPGGTNQDYSDLPPPSHAHPMSGEPIWDQHAVRAALSNKEMTVDNKQSVLTDDEIRALSNSVFGEPISGLGTFARNVEQAVLSKLRGAGEPVAWMVYLPSAHEQYIYDDQDDVGYVDDLTNNPDAEVTPLYAAPQASADPSHPAPASSEDQAIYDSMANSHHDRQQRDKEISAWHTYIRKSLKLDESAPYRFDYYAQVIDDRQQRGGDSLQNLATEKFASDKEREAFDRWFYLAPTKIPPETFTDDFYGIALEVWRSALSTQKPVEGDAKDAERYRWLRNPCSGAERVIFYSRGDYGKGLMSSSMLDAAIDAAMAQQRQGEGE